MSYRSVFFVSDGTGITAEAFGNAILAQFDINCRRIRIPFVDNEDKAFQALRQINHACETDKARALVFSTIVNPGLVELFAVKCQGMLMDMFSTFVAPLEEELCVKSLHRVGRFSDVIKSQAYHDRIEAINYALAHDDGESDAELEQADVILIGVSRVGKTPTSLYLAMQHGLKVANYPLIPEDFVRQQLPLALKAHRRKLFGLSISPERLTEIRQERRPNSRYATLENCREEVAAAESMMRRSGIEWMSTTTKSIEEIATMILQVTGQQIHF